MLEITCDGSIIDNVNDGYRYDDDYGIDIENDGDKDDNIDEGDRNDDKDHENDDENDCNSNDDDNDGDSNDDV